MTAPALPPLKGGSAALSAAAGAQSVGFGTNRPVAASMKPDCMATSLAGHEGGCSVGIDFAQSAPSRLDAPLCRARTCPDRNSALAAAELDVGLSERVSLGALARWRNLRQQQAPRRGSPSSGSGSERCPESPFQNAGFGTNRQNGRCDGAITVPVSIPPLRQIWKRPSFETRVAFSGTKCPS